VFSTERVDPAEPPGRGRHCTSEGKSFRQDWYEAIPGRLLAEVSATPEPLVRAVLDSLQAEPVVRPSELALARIDRQVAEASARLAKIRDIGEWQAAMSRLDAEKVAILAAAPRPEVSDAADDAAFVRDLGSLWSRSAARIKQELALAFWGSWEFLGFKSATYRWSEHALRYGLDRLVPAEITFDLSELGLHSSPVGRFTIRVASDAAGISGARDAEVAG